MYSDMTDADEAPETEAERQEREAFVARLCDNICGEWCSWCHSASTRTHTRTCLTESLAEQGHADYVEELEALADMGGVLRMFWLWSRMVMGMGVVMA
jgi:hypothetical protein